MVLLAEILIRLLDLAVGGILLEAEELQRTVSVVANLK